MNEITFDENNMAVIPEGYQWCAECNALTPHVEGHYTWQKDCIICGNSNHDNSYSCPNCGYDQEEDFCTSSEIIVHGDGCHYQVIEDEDSNFLVISLADQILKDFRKSYMQPAPDRGDYMLPRDREWYDANQKLKKNLKAYSDMFKCSCPRYEVFTNIHNIVTASGYGHGMDCSNDTWWSWKKRCHICGCVFEGDDSSC